jgi:hypothetical protein
MPAGISTRILQELFITQIIHSRRKFSDSSPVVVVLPIDLLPPSLATMDGVIGRLIVYADPDRKFVLQLLLVTDLILAVIDLVKSVFLVVIQAFLRIDLEMIRILPDLQRVILVIRPLLNRLLLHMVSTFISFSIASVNYLAIFS